MIFRNEFDLNVLIFCTDLVITVMIFRTDLDLIVPTLLRTRSYYTGISYWTETRSCCIDV